MQHILVLVCKTESDQNFTHMKISSFEAVPSVHYAPTTEKQPNNRKTRNNNKKRNKEQRNKNKKLRGLNNLI